MKWAHLPVAGGIYDQSPDFIDGIQQVFAAQARKAARDAEKARLERESARNKPKRR